jgi:hypothetical protein
MPYSVGAVQGEPGAIDFLGWAKRRVPMLLHRLMGALRFAHPTGLGADA